MGFIDDSREQNKQNSLNALDWINNPALREIYFKSLSAATGIPIPGYGNDEGLGTPNPNKYARENKERVMQEQEQARSQTRNNRNIMMQQDAARADYLRRQLPDDVDIDVPEYLATR